MVLDVLDVRRQVVVYSPFSLSHDPCSLGWSEFDSQSDRAQKSSRGSRSVQHKLLSREGIRMRALNVAAVSVAALALTGSATASVSVTGADAVKKAQACLLAKGAIAVTTGVIGNGAVSWGHGQNADWTYTLTKAWPLRNGTATGVRLIHYDKRMTASYRRVVKRCVYAALPA